MSDGVEELKKFRERARSDLQQNLDPESFQKLEGLGLLEPFIQLNAWMMETEKTLDRHEANIHRLGSLPEKLKDDIGWLRGSTEILQKFIETDTKFRLEQMEILRKQDQRWDERDKLFAEDAEKHRQLITEVSKASVEATDRLTKAVEEFRLVMEKAVQDGQRPRLGPGGMGP